MSAARRQYTEEFKREAFGLVANNGRPLSQIAEARGFPAAQLRAWRHRSAGSQAGSSRRPSNRLAQKFAAERPNQVWLAGITMSQLGNAGSIWLSCSIFSQ